MLAFLQSLLPRWLDAVSDNTKLDNKAMSRSILREFLYMAVSCLRVGCKVRVTDVLLEEEKEEEGRKERRNERKQLMAAQCLTKRR